MSDPAPIHPPTVAEALANYDRGIPEALLGMSYAVIPVYGVTDEGHCTCHSGALCPSPGKHPSGSQWQLAGPSLGRMGANAGLRCGPQPNGEWLVAFDCDQPDKARAALLELGINPKATYCQSTPSGGFHAIYSVDPKWGDRFKNKVKPAGLGFDLRVANGQVVLAGSRTPKGPYVATAPEKPLAFARLDDFAVEKLLAVVAATKNLSLDEACAEAMELSGDVQLSDAYVRPAALHAARLSPAVEGSAGHGATLWAFTVMIRGYLLDPQTASKVLEENWNPRCVPPWDLSSAEDEKQWWRKADEAIRIGNLPWGEYCQTASTMAAWPQDFTRELRREDLLLIAQSYVVDEGKTAAYWASVALNDSLAERHKQDALKAAQWLWTSSRATGGAYSAKSVQGACAQRVAEAYTAIYSKGIQGNLNDPAHLQRIFTLDPGWANKLRWNIMSQRIEVFGIVPGITPASAGPDKATDYHEVDDRMIQRVRAWLSDSAYRAVGAKGSGSASKDAVWEALMTVAKDNPFDPLRDYFLSCRAAWDGVPRLATAAEEYLNVNCAQAPLSNELLEAWFIGAAGRGVQRGYKFDCMLILSGEEGTHKSDFAQHLAPPCVPYTTISGHTQISNDTWRVLGANFLLEDPEMTLGLAIPAEARGEVLKSLITAPSTMLRTPWDRTPSIIELSFVLVGTTNRRRIADDPTGNRRKWVLALEESVDKAALKRDREQLWGEAAARFLAGEKYYEMFDATKIRQQQQDVGADQYGALEAGGRHDAILSDITGACAAGAKETLAQLAEAFVNLPKAGYAVHEVLSQMPLDARPYLKSAKVLREFLAQEGWMAVKGHSPVVYRPGDGTLQQQAFSHVDPEVLRQAIAESGGKLTAEEVARVLYADDFDASCLVGSSVKRRAMNTWLGKHGFAARRLRGDAGRGYYVVDERG